MIPDPAEIPQDYGCGPINRTRILIKSHSFSVIFLNYNPRTVTIESHFISICFCKLYGSKETGPDTYRRIYPGPVFCPGTVMSMDPVPGISMERSTFIVFPHFHGTPHLHRFPCFHETPHPHCFSAFSRNAASSCMKP